MEVEAMPLMSRVRTSAPVTPKLDAKIALVQGEIEPAPKSATNPHFKRSYADLGSIIEACRIPLSKHGVARYQPAWSDDAGTVTVTTRLAHGGEWIEADLTLPVDKRSAQAVGSAITYAKRYGLAAMLGIPTVDDDGEGAGEPAPPPTARAPIRPQPLPTPPPSRGYLDIEGPRCTGKAAGLAKGNRDRTKALAALHKAPVLDVWTSVCNEAGIPAVNTGQGPQCPTTDQLLVVDGMRIREMLDSKIDACQVREPGDDGDEQEPLEPPAGAP